MNSLGTHDDEKWKLMKRFFHVPEENRNSLLSQSVMFAFLGRICEQKGVHLITNVFEYLHEKYQGRIYFVIAGKIDDSEYSKYCAERLSFLK